MVGSYSFPVPCLHQLLRLCGLVREKDDCSTLAPRSNIHRSRRDRSEYCHEFERLCTCGLQSHDGTLVRFSCFVMTYYSKHYLTRELLPIVIVFVGAENMFNLVRYFIAFSPSLTQGMFRWMLWGRHQSRCQSNSALLRV